MPRNVEIKASIPSVQMLVPLAQQLAAQGPVDILQDDTFFEFPNGRLKLRVLSKDNGALIFYRRTISADPRNHFTLAHRPRRRIRSAKP